jgi:UbiD family decarboxylase
MEEFVVDLEKIGQLVRIKDEKRADELPTLMDSVHDKAVLVENLKDYDFSFLAGAYSTREQYAHALSCAIRKISPKIAELATRRIKPELVSSAPFKEVILKGDDVDLTKFPLFLYHPYDGHAYIQDVNVVSRHPDSGLINWGMYRLMFRSKNETNVDMRNDSHNSRVIAKKYEALGQDMPAAMVIGGPTLDKIACMFSFPGVDDWDILSGFYGEPAKVVKCETNDLTVPANAEIVLEGRIITTEGWIYDEGPYGEFTGTYGGGLPQNCRFIVDCICHRKNAVYQHATIGGLKPGLTDLMIFNLAVEGDIFTGLKNAGLQVLDVYMPPGGCSNIAYARIRTRGGGDAKQALSVMLSCSRQWFPKLAYVFDEDIDIFDDDRVKWAMAWRYNPQKDTIIIPELNILPLDPLAQVDKPPVNMSKVGFDCTVPLVGGFDHFSFIAATVTEPFGQAQQNMQSLGEDELVRRMADFIEKAPRTWCEILKEFHGQPNPLIYRAFGQLRPKLGRIADRRPDYPYTFADTWFVYRK